jgi:SSS family solute:Na+ symporter
MAGLTLGIPIYAIFLKALPGVAFLNHMAFTFLILVLVMGVITLARPLPQPVRFEQTSSIVLVPSRWARWGGALVVAATAVLYIVFW